MLKLHHLAILALFTYGTSLQAKTWHCMATESSDIKGKTTQLLTLTIAKNKAILRTKSHHIELEPLITHVNGYDYIEQETSNIENERITSKVVFRFDNRTHTLIYINMAESHQLIKGECKPKKSPPTR